MRVDRIPDVPDHFPAWLRALFPEPREWDELTIDSIFIPEAAGRMVNDLFQNELTDLRDGIAHALSSESGEPSISADEALHLHHVTKWLPVTRCIVRRMFRSEFPNEFLVGLPEFDPPKGEPSAVGSGQVWE
jgi:hypothetical protein